MPLRFVRSDPAFRGGAPALASPFTSPRGKRGLCSFALISVLWKVAEPRSETQRSAPPAHTVGAADAPPSPRRRHRPLAAAAPRRRSVPRGRGVHVGLAHFMPRRGSPSVTSRLPELCPAAGAVPCGTFLLLLISR